MPGDVLIAGAGPSGLVLALWLTHQGIPVRIIDKTSAPGTTTRAFAVQARTLELYQQIDGLAEDVYEEGTKVTVFNLWAKGRSVAKAPVGQLGKDLSPFPFLLTFPQDLHEKLLIRYLEKAGVKVERQTELVDFSDNGTSVTAMLKKPDGSTETKEFAYLAGCDGAASMVRKTLGIGYPGGTYEQIFYVADVDGTGIAANNKEPYFCLAHREFCLVFPLKHGTGTRLVGIVPEEVRKAVGEITFDDVRAHVKANTGIDVTQVNWFSTYHSHHRMAETFSRGRVFLLGDAAHIHSPAGGQGMNTGIGDAVNIAWKLKAVLRGEAPESLLFTYAEERMKFARRLIRTTDQVFTVVSSRSWVGSFFRTVAFPFILPRLLKIPFTGKFLFKTVSQLVVNYEGCVLSEGPGSGDRLPWIESIDNYAPVRSMNWQTHVYGTAPDGLADFCRQKNIPLHVFSGVKRDVFYLVRPDGYIGFAGKSVVGLGNYLRRHGLFGS